MGDQRIDYGALRTALAADCARCCGLCCVGLCFSKVDGFPADKPAGEPCVHLTEGYRCAVHGALKERGLRGCLAFDCFGAGQAATARYGSWRAGPEIFAGFQRALRLRRMLWYLLGAAARPEAGDLLPALDALIRENEGADDLEAYQDRVNGALKAVIARVCTAGRPKGPDLAGRDLRRRRLEGLDLSMTLLIAANLSGCGLRSVSLLGADLRDADLRGADLRESLFLTQGQLNGARGDGATRLPPWLVRPDHWESGEG